MFNGIIFNQGLVKRIKRHKNGINLYLKSNLKVTKKSLGSSIACDGVCLTLISVRKNITEFYLSKETIIRSKFKNIKIDDKVNLENSIKYGQKISGHICQGHVDTVSKVLKIKKIDKSKVIKFKIPILAICCGMWTVNGYFGGTLKFNENHQKSIKCKFFTKNHI